MEGGCVLRMLSRALGRGINTPARHCSQAVQRVQQRIYSTKKGKMERQQAAVAPQQPSVASLLRLQNMVLLAKQLKLPIAYKVRVSAHILRPLPGAVYDKHGRRPAFPPYSSSADDATTTVGKPHATLCVCWQAYEVFNKPGAGGAVTQDLGSSAARRVFLLVVHVHNDFAFKKYLATCSSSDLLLFRGLLLRVGAGQVSSLCMGPITAGHVYYFSSEY